MPFCVVWQMIRLSSRTRSCPWVQSAIAVHPDSAEADLLRVVLAIEEGHDKASNVPFALRNATQVVQMLDKALARTRLHPSERAHALHLRGVVLIQMKEYAAASKDLDDAYRLTDGTEPWILLWCGRASVNDISPPCPALAPNLNAHQYCRRSYARAVQQYTLLIDVLEQRVERGAPVDTMIVFALWELAYAMQLSLGSKQMANSMPVTHPVDEWFNDVYPIAQRAERAEQKCQEVGDGIIHCIARDFVTKSMAVMKVCRSRQDQSIAKEVVLPNSEGPWSPGQLVEVTGLEARQELNGKHGTIQHLDTQTQLNGVAFVDQPSVRTRAPNLTCPNASERRSEPLQKEVAESSVLEGLEACASMQEAAVAEQKRKNQRLDATKLRQFPHFASTNVMRKMLSEEMQAVSQQRHLYQARMEEQTWTTEVLQAREAKPAGAQEEWKRQVA